MMTGPMIITRDPQEDGAFGSEKAAGSELEARYCRNNVSASSSPTLDDWTQYPSTKKEEGQGDFFLPDREDEQDYQHPSPPCLSQPAKQRADYFPPPPSNHSAYYVTFTQEKDPWNPQNFSKARKLTILMVGSYCCLCSTFASTVFTPATEAVGHAFSVSTEVSTLTTSLYMLGYAFGPMVFGPLSEIRGRRLPIVTAMLGFTAFATGSAAGKDLQTVLICRFFTAVMASCPLTVVPGLLGDIFDHARRAKAMAVFAMCLFLGPVLAPFIGGFTVMNSSLGWRFEGYWIVILAGLGCTLTILFLPETYAPVVLSHKAAFLRQQTGNWVIRAQHEELNVSIRAMATKYFTRPITMMATEPVLFLVTFYMSFIYAILYLFFFAYPIVFMDLHQFNPGLAGTAFFAMGIGVFAACITAIAMVPSYSRKVAANDHRPVPRARLPQVMLGGPCITAGVFWFSWTGVTPTIHWMVPLASGLLTGYGFISIFMPLLNYMLDMYLPYAASAIAANTVMRSALAAAFPLFASSMYSALGVGLAGTVLGSVLAALIPVPVIFYLFDETLRRKSRYSQPPQ